MPRAWPPVSIREPRNFALNGNRIVFGNRKWKMRIAKNSTEAGRKRSHAHSTGQKTDGGMHALGLAGRISWHDDFDSVGRWRRRRCAAEEIQSGSQRLDGHYRGVGLRRNGGSFHLSCLRKQRGAPESGSNSGLRRAWRKFPRCADVYVGSGAGRDGGSCAGVATLLSALERNSRCRCETSLLLHRSCNPHGVAEFFERSDRHVRAGVRCGGHFFQSSLRKRTSQRIGAVSRRELDLGYWLVAGWHNRLRNQSSTRFWT